jgi:hypothetical protein
VGVARERLGLNSDELGGLGTVGDIVAGAADFGVGVAGVATDAVSVLLLLY